MSLSGELDPGGEVHDALQTQPDGLHAGLAVALAPKEATEAGDQARHLIEALTLSETDPPLLTKADPPKLDGIVTG
jgi:hypothetical protein